jgi:hypothetical protein
MFKQNLKVKTDNSLFKMMITKVTQAPINLYFDVTPISRILNSFLTDLQSVDDTYIDQFDYLFSRTSQIMTIIWMTY